MYENIRKTEREKKTRYKKKSTPFQCPQKKMNIN